MRILVSLLLPVLLFGCHYAHGSRPDESEMLASKVMQLPGREVLWEWVKMELGRGEFTLDVGKSDPGQGKFESHWLNLPSSHRFLGVRKKAVGVIKEMPASPGSFRVYIAVWMQSNADMEDPFDVSKAIWEDEERDTAMAEYLIYRIESHYRE